MKTENINATMEDLKMKWAEKLRNLDKQEILDNVRYKFIAAEKMKMVSTIVSKEFADINIGYVVNVDVDDEYTATAIVTSGLMESAGITQEELESAAFTNTGKDNYEIKPIKQIIAETIGVLELPVEEPVIPMYVITNTMRLNGAVAMMIPEIMRRASRKLGGDFLILPSSVHQIIAIPADVDLNVEEFREMVSTINMKEVMPNERLSNNVFRYDSRKGEVVVA